MAVETFVLNPESLAKTLQMAGNRVETLQYLQSALIEKTRKSGTEYLDLNNEMAKLVDYAESQAKNLTELDFWSGARDVVSKLGTIFNTSEFSAFQDFMATRLANKVPVERITLDCQISDEAGFIRGYSMNGKELQGEVLEAMDILFNSWLAQPETKMTMQDGVIYAGTDTGEVAKDGSASAVKARADKVRALISDPVRGFERYVQQKQPGAQVSVVQHEAVREEPAPSQ